MKNYSQNYGAFALPINQHSIRRDNDGQFKLFSGKIPVKSFASKSDAANYISEDFGNTHKQDFDKYEEFNWCE